MSRRKKEVYPCDLCDAQWELVAPVLRQVLRRSGRISRRALLNAIFYVHRTGCQWRFLPHSYPLWTTVYSCFWRWQKSGVWDAVLEALRVEVRYAQGALCPRPHRSSLCGQRGFPKRENHGKRGPRGYDGAKKLCGRKRMSWCDAGGNWLESVVRPANIGERAGALLLFAKVKAALWSHNLTLIWADEGFAGVDFEAQVQDEFGWKLSIGSQEPEQKGFCVQRKRWLIEQVFGCWGRYRRLSRDYEQNPDCSRATLQVASLHRWLRRLKPAPSTDPPFRYRTSRSL